MQKRIYLYSIHPSGDYAVAVVAYKNTTGKTNPYPFYTATHAGRLLQVTQQSISKYSDTDTAVRGCLVRTKDEGMVIYGDYKKNNRRYAIYDALGNRIHKLDTAGVTYRCGRKETITSPVSLMVGNTLAEIRELFPKSYPALRQLQRLTSDKLAFRTLNTNRGVNKGVLIYDYKGLYVMPIIPFLIKNTVNTMIENVSVCSVHGVITTKDAAVEHKRLASLLEVKLKNNHFVRVSKRRFGKVCISCKQKTFSREGLAASLAYQYKLTALGESYESIHGMIDKKMLYLYVLNMGSGQYRPALINNELVQNGNVRIGTIVYESIAHYISSIVGDCDLLGLINIYNDIIERAKYEYTDAPATYIADTKMINLMFNIITNTNVS